MEWINSKTRPEEDGRYLVHIYRSYFVSFAGLDKTNTRKPICIYNPLEYVVQAEYLKCNDEWRYINNEGEEEEIEGIFDTSDYRDAVCQTKIVEWCKMPAFNPVSPSYKPSEDMDIEFENPYIASLVRQRKKSNDTLYKCNYNSNNGNHYVEVTNEQQYKAFVFFFTVTKTDTKTGEISYIEPDYEEFSGEGIYKAALAEDEIKYSITKINNITEMFHSMM